MEKEDAMLKELKQIRDLLAVKPAPPPPPPKVYGMNSKISLTNTRSWAWL